LGEYLEDGNGIRDLVEPFGDLELVTELRPANEGVIVAGGGRRYDAGSGRLLSTAEVTEESISYVGR
jgi:hypothetical protein